MAALGTGIRSCFARSRLLQSHWKGELLAGKTCFGPLSVRGFAARKGKRERLNREKRARKLEDVKKELLPGGWMSAKKSVMPTRQRTVMFHPSRMPIDDVWIALFNKRQLFPIAETIQMHRETHHPTMYNKPDEQLYLSLELNMTLEKKNKFMDKFVTVIRLPHYFNDGKIKTVLALCKQEADQNAALAAGADLVGGTSLVKKIQNGEVIPSDYKYVVAHPDMIQELSPIRGVLKRQFPTLARGNLGPDMESLVKQFKQGLECVSEKDTVQHDFGWVETPVGPLSMPAEHLEANIAAVVEAIVKLRPPKLGAFITLALLKSPPSTEKIGIDISKYQPVVEELQEDDDEEEVKQ